MKQMINWSDLLRFGCQVYGILPKQFWDLTPAEFLLMAFNPSVSERMTKDDLNALIVKFPDKKGDK